MAGNINNTNYAKAGLNTDSVISDVSIGYVTDALNAINSSFSGQRVSYQNEEGNVFLLTLPVGYKAIGIKNIVQLNQVYYFLTNPTTGYSLFGAVTYNTSIFVPYIDDSVPGSNIIGWSVQHPILKIEVKTTNCSTQVYFTDNFNQRRYIDINNLPFFLGSSKNTVLTFLLLVLE